MPKIADYYVHGRGRGHASRSVAVTGSLSRAGYSVRTHAGGDAIDLMDTDMVRPRRPLSPGPLAPFELLGRTVTDAAYFSRERSSLVVSDGDHGAILGARVSGLPVLSIGHDLIFDERVRSVALPAGPLRFQRLNSAPTRAAHRWIAVHFLPAVSDDPRLMIARPETVHRATCPADPAGPVVCYFRDGHDHGVARAISAAGGTATVFGVDGPKDLPPGVNSRPFSRGAFQEALREASAVVASAGSNVIAECVLLGKPILAVHATNDGEQLLNAVLVERENVGVRAEAPEAAAAIPAFLARVRARDFAQVDLASQLPSLSEAITLTLRRWEPSGVERFTAPVPGPTTAPRRSGSLRSPHAP